MEPFTSSQTDLLRSFTRSGYLIKPANYLVEQLAFYGAYHTAFGNQLIHFIFVPMLLISGTSLGFMLLSSYINFYVFLIGWSCMYPLTYIYIDTITGLAWIPIAIITWYISQYVVNTYSLIAVSKFFVVSFGIQILSHYVIEKRKPAFLDALYQSLVLAPFFVFFELVIFPLGFYSETRDNVHIRIEEIQEKMDIKQE
eukprot:367648_1